MDPISAENYENGFDDNGLQHALMLASDEDIASYENISEKVDADYSQLSHCDCDAIPIGKDEEDAPDCPEVENVRAVPLDDKSGNISFVFPEVVHLANDDENTQLMIHKIETDSKRRKERRDNFNLSECSIIKKEGAEDVDGGSALRPKEVETKEAKFKTGRSAKDGGRLNGTIDLDIQSSMVYFIGTFYTTISYKFSASLAIGLLFLMPSVGVGGALTSVPANTLVAVGRTARINCSTDLDQPVFWARTPPQTNVEQWLYYGKDGFNRNSADARFSIIDKDMGTGRYDLIIDNVQQKDAGRYVCLDESGIGATASAELVVTDPMKCDSHIPSDGAMGNNVFGIEQDFIQIACSLTYTGNLSPTLEWSWPGSEVDSDEPMVFASTSSVTSTLKLSPTKERDNATFRCKANIEGATQHIIDSGHQWESKAVSIRYAEFASKDVNICPGVKWNLICNPPCSYQFEREDNYCQCRYTYYDTRKQETHETTSDVVGCNRARDNPLLYLMTIALLVPCVTIIIIVACRLQKKRNKRADEDDEATNKRLSSDASDASVHNSNDDNSMKPMLEKTDNNSEMSPV